MKKIWNVLEETKNMKPTNIEREITFKDLNCIWKEISQHIKKCLQHQKSVVIKEVGTFTLKKWTLDAGIQHEIKVFQPMFLLSRALMEDYDLHQRKEYATDKIPVTVLNLTEIMKSCNCSKETVILCLDKVIQCFRQLIADKKDLLLEFPQLGELKIVNTVAKFTFFEQITPNEEVPKKSCNRFESAIKPYKKQKINPCPLHAEAFTEDYYTQKINN